VTGGTFANAQLFLEDRYYLEKEDFLSFNPGMKWQPTDLLQIEFQANATRSHFFRDAPSIGLFTDIKTVNYSNATGSEYPTFDAGLDTNDAGNWGWAGQRAYIQQEFRYSYTNGLHLDASYGGDDLKLTAGVAYDDTYRKIRGRDNSGAWQAAVCGGNPSVYLSSPNSQPVCDGVNATHPSYPGYGTGYSAGFDNIAWKGSFIPESEVKNYLVQGDDGYANVNWQKLKAATDYDGYTKNAPESTYTNTGALVGLVDEKTIGSYWQLNGSLHPGTRDLIYSVGLRWVETHQTIGGPVSIADTRNADLEDGGYYPATLEYAYTKNVYQAFLPSMNIVYNVADDVQFRFAASRTMTRPDPNAMLPNVGFSDPSADIATVGNPALKPYYSNNLDFSVAYFTGAEGYVSLSAFRKSISGFTINGLTTHPFSELAGYGITYNTLTNTQKTAIDSRGGAENATVEFSQNVNASGLLTINGMELSWVQPLDFLLARYGLSGLGFTANLTIVDQRGSGAAPATAVGVSPYTYNIVGYYENHGLSVHLSYVFNDKQQATATNQASITDAAIFTKAYDQMDMSASYKLSGLFGDIPSDPELTLNVQNLANSAQSQYFEYSGATFSYYKPGRLIMFGIRGTF
jgi:TonB-dependent receptor